MLKIYEIFPSINGEICNSHQGSLCTFIRLSGCNLRCKKCDTKYAQKENSGKEMKIQQIFSIVKKLGNRNITITGGEPLLQKEDLHPLVDKLSSSGYKISIETNGSIPRPHWSEISWVMDYKLQSTGMNSFMRLDNFYYCWDSDIIKFVVETKSDFDQAESVVKKLLKYNQYCTFSFSPCFHGKTTKVPLKDWMENSKVLKKEGAVLSLQIHKLFNWK